MEREDSMEHAQPSFEVFGTSKEVGAEEISLIPSCDRLGDIGADRLVTNRCQTKAHVIPPHS